MNVVSITGFRDKIAACDRIRRASMPQGASDTDSSGLWYVRPIGVLGSGAITVGSEEDTFESTQCSTLS